MMQAYRIVRNTSQTYAIVRKDGTVSQSGFQTRATAEAYLFRVWKDKQDLDRQLLITSTQETVS